jgi:hypothetical protein
MPRLRSVFQALAGFSAFLSVLVVADLLFSIRPTSWEVFTLACGISVAFLVQECLG